QRTEPGFGDKHGGVDVSDRHEAARVAHENRPRSRNVTLFDPMRVVLLACFFLSGASGLVLETLWTRMLTLVFGSTTLAVSTVLATFMGGLGLGSYLAGRLADRLPNPVRAYALTEAAIGGYALVVPAIVSLYPALNRWMWSALGDH